MKSDIYLSVVLQLLFYAIYKNCRGGCLYRYFFQATKLINAGATVQLFSLNASHRQNISFKLGSTI